MMEVEDGLNHLPWCMTGSVVDRVRFDKGGVTFNSAIIFITF
jgi:hypothetical protein